MSRIAIVIHELTVELEGEKSIDELQEQAVALFERLIPKYREILEMKEKGEGDLEGDGAEPPVAKSDVKEHETSVQPSKGIMYV